MPHIPKFTFRAAIVALGRFEQHIIIRVRVKRRVEIHEVDALILDLVAKDREVVAAKQRIDAGCHAHGAVPL